MFATSDAHQSPLRTFICWMQKYHSKQPVVEVRMCGSDVELLRGYMPGMEERGVDHAVNEADE